MLTDHSHRQRTLHSCVIYTLRQDKKAPLEHFYDYCDLDICPVLGCTSKSQIRLADHIRGDHPTISKEYRLSLCQRAVVVSKKEHVPQSGQGVQTLGRDLSPEAAGAEAMPSLSNTRNGISLVGSQVVIGYGPH